jgi:hypothetical protein
MGVCEKSLYLIILFYLTPLIPLSFEGEGEFLFKRGFASL